MNDLLEKLRGKEYPNLSDVAFAILEPNGTLSVISKEEGKPRSPDTQDKPVFQPRLPITLIIDGHVNLRNLKLAKMSIDQLVQAAKNQQIDDLREVFFAQLTTKKQLDFYRK